MKSTFSLSVGVLLLCILIGCAGKVDPNLLDTNLLEAEKAVSLAEQAGAETRTPKEFAKAVQLLADAKQSREEGHSEHCLDQATRALLTAQIAAAEARVSMSEERLASLQEEITRSRLGQMAHQVAAAQARQMIAEKHAEMAESNAAQARDDAAEARAEALQAQQDALTKIRVAETQLAISRAEDLFQQAIEADSMTHAPSLHSEAERLLRQARSLLQAQQYDTAIQVASQAEDQANRARIKSMAVAETLRKEAEASQQQALTEARVAVAKAQLSLDQALALQADAYMPEDYRRADQELQSARAKLESSQYIAARQLAEQAQLHAVQLQERTQKLAAEQQAQRALEEKIARAKDALFKAQNQVVTEAETLRADERVQADGLLAKAQRSISESDYDQAVAIAGQVNDLVNGAIARMTRIRQKEQRIAAEATQIKDAQISTTDRGVMIRFGGNIFTKGSSKLTDQILPSVKQLAQLLARYEDYDVLIEGHTDNSGNPEYNLRLSKERADSFMAYLIDAARLRRGRLRPEGLGESQPITPNSDEDGQRQNRRIDVILLTREGQ